MAGLIRKFCENPEKINLEESFPYYNADDMEKLKQCVTGQYALEFNCAYMSKMPKSVFIINIPQKKDGKVIKTAPDTIIEEMLKILVKYEQNFVVYRL